MENLKPAEENTGGKKKILIVEDDEITRKMYADVLREKGFEVSEAVDGLEGFDKAIKEKPDLIFTGIMMPKMDGFTVCEEIRKRSDVPVIMLTALGSTEDLVRGFELGADDYISKPFKEKKVSSLFMTHPPVQERVKALRGIQI